ncbi:MAG: hypothetical protein IKM13_02485 [Clostridia bacterium]|nr:hypothetical protein [Clostridia bacterium]
MAKEYTFPRFMSSDKELDLTYQYRCELYIRHIRETPAGHVITEFLPDVPWAGIYNTINCAAHHHFRDGRWLTDSAVLREYADFWCSVGNPRLYSFPITDSILAWEKVTGDESASRALYPKLAEICRAWDDHKTENGMYRQLCDRDGMEYAISGDGLRATINSYMVADFKGLALLAERAGEKTEADSYRKAAETLAGQINALLWNDTIGMFGTISDEGEVQNVRELVGYIPWIYGIPTPGKDGCFRFLLDPACFKAPHGLRTADVSHPDYNKPFDHECLWNGPVWPFATAQTLTAVIEYLQTTQCPTITKGDFMDMLLTYAYSHRDEDGTPWLDENMDPDTGEWLARKILREWNRDDKDRGRHYNHSTFIDLVMTGICGIRPVAENRLILRPLGTSLEHFKAEGIGYHGHTVDVAWNQNTGLRVLVDGSREYTKTPEEDLTMEIEL